jgi:hypothetical protein
MSETIRASDVFGISRDLPLNYTPRKSVDDQLVEALTRDKHLVIYGSSKQGKTSVRKYNLHEDDYLVVTCSNRWDLGQLHAAILKQAGYTVVQSSTRNTSGHFKIKASVGLKARLFGVAGPEGSISVDGENQKGSSDEVQEAPLELDPIDVNDIITALNKINFDRWIVLEDFHYLPEQTQKDFAVALKAFHESSAFTFIVVGVWLQEDRLMQFNGDLSGRVSTINADVWETDELAAAVAEGERLLNIKFDDGFLEVLLDRASESISIVQEACLLACQQAGIAFTQPELTKVTVADGGSIIAKVVNQQSARFSDFLSNFADGFGETELKMYRWLLVPVVAANQEALQSGLAYRKIRKALSAIHPRGEELNAGNVTQALQSVARLQVKHGVKPLVLDYDQSLRRLNVVDRSFSIWLGQQDQEDLLDIIDINPTVLEKLQLADLD